MKQKAFKINQSTLFVYKSIKSVKFVKDTTDPTNMTITLTTTGFNK